MKYSVLALLITLIAFTQVATSCKVNDQKNMEESDAQLEAVNIADLAHKRAGNLKPDEAKVSFEVTSIGVEGDLVTIQAKVISVEQVGFGFNDYLTKGEEVIIRASGGTSIDSSKKNTCIIRKITVPNQTIPIYQLVKLI